MNSLLINLNAGKRFSILMNIGQNIRLPSTSTGTRLITRRLFLRRQQTQENTVTSAMYLSEYASSAASGDRKSVV